MTRATGLVLLALAAGGCATRGGVRSIPAERGEEKLFEGSVRDAARAARTAIVATHLPIIEAGWRGSDGWYLIAYTPADGYVRVFCQDVGGGEVAVRVLGRRRVVIDGPVHDWSETLFALVALDLSEVGS